MAIKTCDHIRENGLFCEAAAVKNRRFCWYHLQFRGRRMRMAQARARGQQWKLDLPPLEDMHAVQSALSQVVDAIVDQSLDTKRAGLLLYALQQASANVSRGQNWIGNSRYHVYPETSFRALDHPNFEQTYGLSRRLDLDLPPDVAFPCPDPSTPEPVVSATAASAQAKKPNEPTEADSSSISQPSNLSPHTFPAVAGDPTASASARTKAKSKSPARSHNQFPHSGPEHRRQAIRHAGRLALARVRQLQRDAGVLAAAPEATSHQPPASRPAAGHVSSKVDAPPRALPASPPSPEPAAALNLVDTAPPRSPDDVSRRAADRYV